MDDLKKDLNKHTTPILKNAEKLGLLDQQVHMFASTDPANPLQVSIMLKQNQDSWTLSIKEKQEYLFVFKNNNVIYYVNKTDPYTPRVWGAGAAKNPSAGGCTGIANLLLSGYIDKKFIPIALNPTPAPEKTAVSTAPAALFSIVVTPPLATKPVTHPTDTKTITNKP